MVTLKTFINYMRRSQVAAVTITAVFVGLVYILAAELLRKLDLFHCDSGFDGLGCVIAEGLALTAGAFIIAMVICGRMLQAARIPLPYVLSLYGLILFTILSRWQFTIPGVSHDTSAWIQVLLGLVVCYLVAYGLFVRLRLSLAYKIVLAAVLAYGVTLL